MRRKITKKQYVLEIIERVVYMLTIAISGIIGFFALIILGMLIATLVGWTC